MKARKRRPDVVHVLPRAVPLGGAERTVIDLLRSPHLRDLDQRVIFLEPSGAKEVFPEDLVIAAEPSRLGIFRVLAALRACRPRILHGWLYRGNVVVCLAKLLLPRVRVLTSERNIGHAMTSAKRVGERAVAPLEDVVVANSEAVRDAAVARRPARASRIRVIRPGVRPRPALPSPPSSTGVMVGRLQPVKDHHTALRIWTRVITKFPGAILTILGEGPERARIEASVRAAGLEASVLLPGDRDPWPFLQGAHLYLSTSTAEGWPRASIEAMAAGLPIVTTDVGGCSELPNDVARKAPAGDDRLLAEHVLAVLADPDARRRVSARALHHADTTFSERRCHEEYRTLYVQVASMGRHRRT